MQVGDIVYYYDRYVDGIIKSTITKIYETNKCSKNMTDTFTVADLHMSEVVDKSGNRITIFPGSTTRKLKDLYTSVNAATNTMENENKALKEKYCKKIATLEDLLTFPLEYSLCDSELNNYEAIEAYKIRAKELTGIDLNKR